MSEERMYAALALMVVGGLCLTVLSDIVASNAIALGLSGGGGLVFLVGGLWLLHLSDDRDVSDERYLQLWFRASTLSFWALFVGLLTFSSLESAAEITYPVLSNYSWLLIGGVIVFVTSWAWYDRRM